MGAEHPKDKGCSTVPGLFFCGFHSIEDHSMLEHKTNKGNGDDLYPYKSIESFKVCPQEVYNGIS
jgi:hypothetical protein